MADRDQKEDRAEALLEDIKPNLLKLLKASPEYGSVGLDLHLHQGQVIKLSMRSEITRKVTPRTGGRDE
jgi:hypothetical protein